MSRLDYVTIAIVGAILLILGFLVFRVVGLFNEENGEPIEQTEQTIADLQNAEEPEEDTYKYDDEGDIVKEDIEEALPAKDIDLDDEELGDYDEIADEPTVDDYTADQESEEYNDEDSTTPDAYDEEETADDDTDSTGGDYMVIAGSFTVKANAEREVSRLKDKGYDNAEVGMFNRGTYANVIVDRFDSVERAKELAKELKSKGIPAYVQEKRGN